MFFLLVLGLILAIYGYFAPTYKYTKDAGEIPKIELYNFTLYEISHRGIDHLLEGKEGKKFEEYYTVTSAKFSDNTKHLLHFVESDRAHYRDDFLKLDGNLRYTRQDGLEFHTQRGTYDTKKGVIVTPESFFIVQNNHRIDGENIRYEVDRQWITANRIRAKYQLP